MMRLILHNPHNKIFFWQTVFDFLLRSNISKKSQKYKYILNFLWKEKIKFWIYLDYQGSSLPLYLQKSLLIKIEVFFWLLIKGINPIHVKIIDKVEQLKKNDIFFSFSLTTLDTNYHGIDDISNKDIIKVFHFTHYVQNTSLIAANFKTLKWDFIIAENNLQKSLYFQHHFWYFTKPVYTLPFTYWEKYKNYTNFYDRRKKALSVWAIINVSNYKGLFNDFSSFYKSNTLQPIRQEILDRWDAIDKYIDTTSQTFLTSRISFFEKIKKIITWSRYEYYNFDIVEKYNEYQMFICGEELWGMPWIGFVEWMACGCAYIGKIDSMYTDIGLLPWVHYIWHDGTLQDILKKIQYYQEHIEELEKIANMWYDFVRENFSWDIVAKKFYKDLILLVKKYNKTGQKKKIQCSFREKNSL